MDVATLIGIGVAFAAVIASIFMEGSSPMSVVLPAPMMLVIGGTLGAGLATTTLKGFIAAFSSLGKYLLYKQQDAGETVDLVVSLADKARREGLLALEDATRDIDDDFIKDGLQSAIDGTDPEDLRAIMEAQIDGQKAADKAIAKVFADMGGFAPTIGIIGTVVSLVHVLENLDQPATLGHMIAAAFVATLWGLLSANLIWLPISARIKRISELEAQKKEMAMEGLLAIQAGANPRSVGARLRALAFDAKKPAKEAA
ncbi:flagellar motor protein [Demequina zhanjiangensis]|uniref:Flagellar motor protein n=1 Tax=Demequina zhanjiangensis TaxID=3051659 RepID=A0ABT8FZW7_9MICO|nr:flagellar motor protein [Demequina sp. SYSU T00b26]MDN4472368.1 flagellar motor protein [Demequina sp. SYSU T00b26]